MSKARKLQLEVDATLKKAAEGCAAWDREWQKLQNEISPEDTIHYDRQIDTLKQSLKKLQKMREAVRGWLASGEIKGQDEALAAARYSVESCMERFRVLERELKIKEFSKAGLMRNTEDPEEVAKGKTADWLGTCVDRIQTQIEVLEADLEELGGGGRGGRNRPSSAAAALHDAVAKRQDYLVKIEQALRLLENDQVSHEEVENALKDSLEYFIEAGMEPDFVGDDEMWDLLPLGAVDSGIGKIAAHKAGSGSLKGTTGEESFFGVGVGVDDSTATSAVSVVAAASPAAGAEAPTPLGKGKAGAPGKKEASGSKIKGVGKGKAGLGKVKKEAGESSAPGSPAVGSPAAAAAAAARSAPHSFIAALHSGGLRVEPQPQPQMMHQQQPPPPPPPGLTLPPPGLAAVTAQPPTPLSAISVASGRSTLPSPHGVISTPGTGGGGGPSSAVSSPYAVVGGATPPSSAGSAFFSATTGFTGTDATTHETPPPSAASATTVTSSSPVAAVVASAPSPSEASAPPSEERSGRSSGEFRASTPFAAKAASAFTPHGSLEGTPQSATPTETVAAVSPPRVTAAPLMPPPGLAPPSDGLQAPAPPAQPPLGADWFTGQWSVAAEAAGSLAAVGDGAGGPHIPWQPSPLDTSLLEAYAATMPTPEDSVLDWPGVHEGGPALAGLPSGRRWRPLRPALVPPAYPQEPPPNFFQQSFFDNALPIDTLFFSFFFHPGSPQQLLAATALKRQGWRYHTAMRTWFARTAQPTHATELYETGVFSYWDPLLRPAEGLAGLVPGAPMAGWAASTTPPNFKFEYAMLENEDTTVRLPGAPGA